MQSGENGREETEGPRLGGGGDVTVVSGEDLLGRVISDDIRSSAFGKVNGPGQVSTLSIELITGGGKKSRPLPMI
jgi:hypothetical protein